MADGMEFRAGDRKPGATDIRQLSRGLALLLAYMVVVLVIGHSHGLADERATFVNMHRCDIAERLTRIEATRTQGGKDRFIVVALEARGQSYVQCLFDEDGASLLCEASSGFYGPAEGEADHLTLSPSEIAGLGALGFDTRVSDGNFQRVLALPDDADLDAVAALVLRALYDGYGAREQSRLEIYAPLARGLGTAPCTPSG